MKKNKDLLVLIRLLLKFADKHPFLVGFISACVSLVFVKEDLIFLIEHLY